MREENISNSSESEKKAKTKNQSNTKTKQNFLSVYQGLKTKIVKETRKYFAMGILGFLSHKSPRDIRSLMRIGSRGSDTLFLNFEIFLSYGSSILGGVISSKYWEWKKVVKAETKDKEKEMVGKWEN